jgi:broad specificity phosphatase PhoE
MKTQTMPLRHASRLFRTAWMALAVALWSSAMPGTAGAAEALGPAALAVPGRVLLLRHAQAPGVGDPPGFRLGDCSTQRNLDDTGRAQAARLGKALAQAGVRAARVHSSAWCRCQETARLLGLGPITTLPALNSLFGRSENAAAQTAELRDFLAGLPVDGGAVVLVTHQVVISALTGRSVASGEGAVLQLNGTAHPALLGEFALP